VAESDDVPAWAIHVDPFDPHAAADPSAPSPIDLARSCAARGATVVYWYGFEEGESSTWAFPEIVRTSISGATAWCGYLLYPEADFDSTIVGCGVIVVSDQADLPDRLDALGEGVVSIYTDAPLPSGGVGSVRFGSEFVSRP
jgi:hypothetical protein